MFFNDHIGHYSLHSIDGTSRTPLLSRVQLSRLLTVDSLCYKPQLENAQFGELAQVHGSELSNGAVGWEVIIC